MVEDTVYYYKRPCPENPEKSVTSFFQDFSTALKNMEKDVKDFFSGADIGVASEHFGLEWERTGNTKAIAVFEEFEWKVGQVA